MRTALLALIFITAAFASTTPFPVEDGVLVLTEKTIEAAIAEFPNILIEFYAPWCGHCKKLAPEYAKAAEQLANDPNVKLAKIDPNGERSLLVKYEVRGFPTIKFFSKKSATPISYEAGRTAPEIVAWLKKKTGPDSILVSSVEQAQKLVNNNQVLFFYLGDEGSALQKAFLSAAAGFEEIEFAHSSNAAVRQHFEAQNKSAIIAFKKFDDGKTLYSGPAETNDIINFIKANRFPTVIPYDEKLVQNILGEGLNALFLVRSADETSEKAEKTLKQAAEYLKGKIAVVVARLDQAAGSKFAESIGIKNNKAPAFSLVQPGPNKVNIKYLFEKKLNVDNLKAFYHDFVDSKLKPYFKSADLPASHEENVRVLVGDNFKEIVLDSDSDVLVEYYAPWCGHCKNLGPIYSQLATRFKTTPGLVIAKMDATANEVDGLQVTGFPTIKFYGKGKKNAPVDYRGDRTEEGFVRFLRGVASSYPDEDPFFDEL